LQADGKILVGGSFTNLAGQPRGNIGRLALKKEHSTIYGIGQSAAEDQLASGVGLPGQRQVLSAKLNSAFKIVRRGFVEEQVVHGSSDDSTSMCFLL
jgi:hypothetical protein